MLIKKSTTRFLSDLKKIKKRGYKLEKLDKIAKLLCYGRSLPQRCRPHKLIGEYQDLWECHIEPDWLLIYRLIEDRIEFIRTGTHSDLF